MNSDPIKEAFQKVKLEIDWLKEELFSIRQALEDLNLTIQQQKPSFATQRDETPTHKLTELPNMPLEALKTPFMHISTGNEGVPTNQPTNQQTNQRSGNEGVAIIPTHKDRITHLQHMSEILGSLDDLKKEVRIKFKQLTEQEMLVFSTIYQLEEQGLSVDYSLLAEHLKLTEISIRDYIRKIISKGIPLVKVKQSNRKILLSVEFNLKKIASLDTILKLREL